MKELLSRNQSAVRARVDQACQRAGRDPQGVQLVAVTKSVDVETTAALFELGQRELGENRFEGLERKVAALAERGMKPRWHFIGHLQRNKARRIARLAAVLHAVDTLELVDTLGRITADEGWQRDVYLQVKLVDEATKYGLAPAQVHEALERAATCAGLHVAGLMTMAPQPAEGDTAGETSDAARSVFRTLRELADDLPAERFAGGRAHLSMGMSGDFETAIEEGSDSVRIGRALFDGLEPSPTGGRGA